MAGFSIGSRAVSALRDRTRGHALGGTESDRAFAWGLVALTLLVAWLGTYLAGGSKTAAPHAFYVPVLLAAVRFKSRQSAIVALLAGLLAGPLMPLDSAAGTAQDFANWFTRLAIFVLIGQMTAYLARYSLPSLHSEIDHRRLRREIETAIEHRQLRVDYQPVVRLATNEIAGVEALVRWDHPDKGLIPPGEFIPAAEQAGCIAAITRFVLNEALDQVAEWRATILRDWETFEVAVNLSASELCDRELTMTVSTALARSEVPSHWVHLEVTETALTENVDRAVDGLMELRMLGVRLAIDDFGTGQSSLAQLHRFPIDVLKIDRFFLDPLAHHERGPVLANGVISLAHAMGLTTIVEGVETAEQASVLRSLGCDLAQGYLFSRPVAPEEIERLLISNDIFGEALRAAKSPPPQIATNDGAVPAVGR